MSTKFENAVESCKKQMKKHKIKCDDNFFHGVAKSLGPSLYNKDASLVAASDKKELETIKKNFIAKKLKVTGPKADSAIQYAVLKLGHSNRFKQRAVFYYLIAQKLGKQSAFKATKRKAA